MTHSHPSNQQVSTQIPIYVSRTALAGEDADLDVIKNKTKDLQEKCWKARKRSPRGFRCVTRRPHSMVYSAHIQCQVAMGRESTELLHVLQGTLVVPLLAVIWVAKFKQISPFGGVMFKGHLGVDQYSWPPNHFQPRVVEI